MSSKSAGKRWLWQAPRILTNLSLARPSRAGNQSCEAHTPLVSWGSRPEKCDFFAGQAGWGFVTVEFLMAFYGRPYSSPLSLSPHPLGMFGTWNAP